jgi:hypothetical protein
MEEFIMKIGIIVYSQTGNTYSVAQRLQEKLSIAGHSANIERVAPVGEVHPGMKNLMFKTLPETGIYDALVIAAPVQAFSLSVPMSIYLRQLSELGNKKIACFVTMAFPYPWLGGNHAIAQMKKICESKNGKVCGTGIVNWSNKLREEQITALVEKVSSLF